MAISAMRGGVQLPPDRIRIEFLNGTEFILDYNTSHQEMQKQPQATKKVFERIVTHLHDAGNDFLNDNSVICRSDITLREFDRLNR